MTSILSYANLQKQWNSEQDVDHVITDLNNNIDFFETLQLTGNTLGVAAAEKLSDPLSKQSKMKVLLWNDLFTGRLKSEIGVALKSLSLGLMTAKVNLVELDLSDNAFGPNGVVGVTDLLASPCCYSLKILNMNNQGLGHQGCRCLIDALKISRKNSNNKGMNLEVFIAGRNRLENAGMRMLTEFFGDGMSSLKKIVLLQNGIGVHGVEGIEDFILSIKNHVNLKILNISDNTIKPNGMKRLCEVLPYFEHLEEIHMDDCLIGSAGLNSFTNILEDTSCDLKIISVSGNEIKGKAAKNFISMLVETKHCIEKVNLTENEIKTSYKSEMKDIMSEHEKDHVLVEENRTEDEESDEESDEETDSGEDSESYETQESESSESLQESEHSEKESETNKTNQFNTPRNIFSSDKSSASTFTFTKNHCQTETGNLFNSKTSNTTFLPKESAASTLFSTKTNQTTNIFKTSISGEPKFSFGMNTNKPFSFLDAAKNSVDDDVKNLKQFIIDNLKSESVMIIEKVSVLVNKNIGKELLDLNIYTLAESHPENSVRVGLILCGETATFDIGVALIDFVLTSNATWSNATNAILVEMNCIKSEEKNFVPFCHENLAIPIKVLKRLLDINSSMSNEVRLNLVTVLRNLNKNSSQETDDLLKTLECSVSNLKI